MENAIIIDGIKHILVPTTLDTKGCDDCKICSLRKECNKVDSALCFIFPNTPNSHFEIKD